MNDPTKVERLNLETKEHNGHRLKVWQNPVTIYHYQIDDLDPIKVDFSFQTGLKIEARRLKAIREVDEIFHQEILKDKICDSPEAGWIEHKYSKFKAT